MRIVVIGTGYVGLPAALLLAQAGHEVIGVDINENVVRAINDGILHIREDELQSIMNKPEVRKNLRAQHTPCEADVFLIAVPTPLDARKKVAEMRYVIEATESIVPHLRRGSLVILESTVPPRTCRDVMTPLLEKSGLRVGQDIFLAHCPERILPGNVFHEIVHNDRIIGAADARTRAMARQVYESFVHGKLYEADDITAELCKLMENTYRDVNVALANEFMSVAETLGIDGHAAIDLANKHPRVNILRPGIGVGGHCIPIDPWFIKEVDPAHSRLIFAARLVNDEMPAKIAGRVRHAVRDLPDPEILAVGVAYKANCDDLRESPALEIVHLLRQDGYRVRQYDPLVKGYDHDKSLLDVSRGADCMVLLVEHDRVMQELSACGDQIKASMRTPRILRF